MNHKNKETISSMFPENVGSIIFRLSTEALAWLDGTTRDDNGTQVANRRFFHDLLVRMRFAETSKESDTPYTFSSEASPLHSSFPHFIFRRPLLLHVGQMQYSEEILSALWNIGRKRVRNILYRMELLGLVRTYPSRIASYMTFPCIDGWELQEKALYSTDFTNWTAYDRKKTTNEVVNLKTLYSKENFTITLNGVGVSPTDGKFAGHTGFMQTAKYTGEYSTAEPSAVTSVLANITKITLHQAATGSKRGIKVSVKGDGDTDWVAIHNQSIVTTKGEDLSLDVNRTNCQIKFENFALAQNAYVTDLAIYGKVDMSKTPMLGSFSLNGEKHQAVDIFNEDTIGKQLATLLISKKATLISESNPLTDITADNGTIKSTTYTTTGEGNDQKTVVTIVVEANGDEATYELTVAFKPDFTLTYYNIDGTTVIGTQTVEQDAIIGSFKQEAEEKVTVADGKKFRGWAPSQEQDEKKYTTSSAFTSDAKLYAVVTDIETANTTARYDFNLQKEGFCADDHEAFCVEGNGKWHDTTHGWSFSAGDKIKILMGGKGYIKLTLCSFSTTGDITLTDPKGNMIASVDAKASKDGFSAILQNNSTESGAYTLTFAATAYLHGLSIVNMTEPAYAKMVTGTQ